MMRGGRSGQDEKRKTEGKRLDRWRGGRDCERGRTKWKGVGRKIRTRGIEDGRRKGREWRDGGERGKQSM